MSECSDIRELATRYGLMGVPQAGDDVIGRFLARYGEWAWLEAAFIASLLPDGARILDAGAFIGTFGLGVARQRNLSLAAFVEANPTVAPILRRNVAANAPCPAVVLDVMLAGPGARFGSPRAAPGNLGGTAFEAVAGDAPGAVGATTLAQLRAEHGPFDLIKLDIEGHELDALRGDAAFLSTGQTTLWLEANEAPGTLTLAGMILSWKLPLFYFAFPSFNPLNFNGAREPIFPFAFEAGLLVPAGTQPVLSEALRDAGCILRPIANVEDLKDALWRTPRWGLGEWAGAAGANEVVALAGHSILGDSYAGFLAWETPASKVTLWQRLDAERGAAQETEAALRRRLAEAEADLAETRGRLAQADAGQTLLRRELAEAGALADARIQELDQLRRARAGAEESLRQERLALVERAARAEGECAQVRERLAGSEALAAALREELHAAGQHHAEIVAACNRLEIRLGNMSATAETTLARLGVLTAALGSLRNSRMLRLLFRVRRAIRPRRALRTLARPIRKIAAPRRAGPVAAASVPASAAIAAVEDVARPASRSDVDPAHRDTVRPHFDALYYLAGNPDVVQSGLDPLDHFLQHGWREHRSPSAAFDTSYYLAAYPDVAAAGINPLLHYLWSGKAEGRLPQRPMHGVRRALEAALPLRTRAADWACGADGSAPLPPAALRKALARPDGHGLVVSVSHDDYAVNCGGIQNVISDEQQRFAAAGHAYLHLSPAAPLPVLADRQAAADYRLRLRLDGSPLGLARFSDLAASLAALRAGGATLSFVFHHLLGHVPELLATLPDAADRAVIVWVHDFFALCANFTLLRNDVSFCGAPPPESGGCAVCVHGQERLHHAGRMRQFLATVRPTVLAPSQSALDVWRRARLPQAGAAIVPPARIVPAAEPVKRTRARPLRVAFVGRASFHKGWDTFERLAAAHAHDPRYAFLHLGLDSLPSSHFARDPVRVGQGRRDAMAEAVVRNAVDVAVIWSLWPETFCFTVHEALAGGAFVVARRGMGNVWPAVEANAPGQGCAVADEQALFALFSSGEILSLHAGACRRRFTLTPGGNTAEYLLRTEAPLPVPDAVCP